MDPEDWMRYELAAVLGPHAPLERLAQALSLVVEPRAPVPMVDLDVLELALLPVVPALAGQLDPSALRARGLERIAGGTQVAAQRRKDLITGPESGFTTLTLGLAAMIEAASMIGLIAYVEADYVGSDGRQAAAVWRSGRLSLGPLLLGRREPFDPRSAPISLALGELGVRTTSRRDAFLIAGLNRYRCTDDWLTAAMSSDEDD